MTDANDSPTMPSSGVIHVFNSLGRGGAELRTLAIVRGCGLSFAFLSVSGQAAELDEAVRKEGHTVYHRRLRSPADVLGVARLLRRAQVKVVHSHLGAASGPVLLAAWLARVPIRIAHSRSDAVGGRQSSLKSAYLAASRLIVRATASKIVGVSPSALAGSGLLRGKWKKHAVVVPNGIDSGALRSEADQARQTRGRGADGLVIAQIAREEPSKNRARGLEIWARLAQKQRTTLKMIGSVSDDDRALASRLANQRAVREMGSSIEVVGEVTDIAGQLGSSDVLLVTSKREGLPGVVLEALACGTPVVSSDLPGVQWIRSLASGVTAISLDADDSDWVDAILAAPTDNDAIADDFERSPFLLERAMAAHLELWGISPGHMTSPAGKRST